MKANVGRRYPVEANDPNFIAVRLASAGRSQLVMITRQPGTSGPDWVLLESGFGAINERSLRTAIDYVGSLDASGIGLGRIEEALTIRWSAFVPTASEEDVVAMIGGVAGHADRLERALSEYDDF